MGNKAESVKKTETAKVTPKPAAKKSKTIATAKVAKPAAVKAKAAPKTVKKPAVTKKSSLASSISRDDVALRAYFIAEKRHQQGIYGDSAHDWLEAERQLIAESKAKKSS